MTEQKTATQGLALNEKPRYWWLNSDKMDGSDENGMVKKWRLELKMAEKNGTAYQAAKTIAARRRHGARKQQNKNKGKQNRTMA